MSVTRESNRRGFMKMLAASPLLAQIARNPGVRKISFRIRHPCQRKCLLTHRRQDGHQLPWHLDVSERFLGVS